MKAPTAMKINHLDGMFGSTIETVNELAEDLKRYGIRLMDGVKIDQRADAFNDYEEALAQVQYISEQLEKAKRRFGQFADKVQA